MTPFLSTADAHCQKMLGIIRAGRAEMLAKPRVDMPYAEPLFTGGPFSFVAELAFDSVNEMPVEVLPRGGEGHIGQYTAKGEAAYQFQGKIRSLEIYSRGVAVSAE